MSNNVLQQIVAVAHELGDLSSTRDLQGYMNMIEGWDEKHEIKSMIA